MERSDGKFITSVYRKPTFTGQYTRWDSYSATSYKIGLIRNLVCRALSICSECKLDTEITRIKAILLENGYPEHIVTRTVARTLEARSKPVTRFGPAKCPVYLKLPWRGKVSDEYASNIKRAVSRSYYAVSTRVVFSTNRMLPSTIKDVLPTSHLSNVVYQYQCRCDARYVGRTSLRLADRIKQHVPSTIRNHSSNQRAQPLRACKSETRLTKQKTA